MDLDQHGKLFLDFCGIPVFSAVFRFSLSSFVTLVSDRMTVLTPLYSTGTAYSFI